MAGRRTVRCWYCGHVARRVPGSRSLLFAAALTRDGRIRVVGRRRTVQPYGACRNDLGGWHCTEPMLLRADARLVLRAAIAHDRSGGNRTSEYG